jgi:xylulokinase
MFLGLDLGTSNVKSLLVDDHGSILAEGSAAVDRSMTPDGGVVQDIHQIWDATCQAVREAVALVDARRVQAVGVSSQGGALQLLDAREDPLGPVISWLDTRGQPFDRQLEELWGTQYLVEHTGCNLSGTTLGQIARLRRETPEVLRAAAAIGYVGDVMVARLCGRRAHDATSLSLAMLYNPTLNAADPGLLRKLGIGDKRLPDLLPATKAAGPLRRDAAAQMGLAEGIPVSPAVHDQYAAALGAGAAGEGDVLVGTGTAWVLLVLGNRLAPPLAPGTFVCRHPVDGLFGQLLSMGGVGDLIQLALETTGDRDIAVPSLDALLATVPAGADGLRFNPALNTPGPTTASSDSNATVMAAGTFSRAASVEPAGILRAVFEGLACELARRLRWFTQAGFPVRRLLVSGPAAAGVVVPQILADVANCPVHCIEHAAPSAFGAAVIARALVDRRPLGELAAELAPPCRVVAPGADQPTYERQLEQYIESFKKVDRAE